jgi:hypothetical protein
MNIKIDNMVDLRAFCLEQAIKIKSEYKKSGDEMIKSPIQLAIDYEAYILGGVSLPGQPFNTDKLLYDTMTEMIKNKEENDVKTRLY